MGFKGPKCTQTVDVYSDFDQNEEHLILRYHKYNGITVLNLTRFIRDDFSLIKKTLEQDEMGKI